MEELDEADMQLIATAAFTRLPPALLTKMIGFTRALQREVVVHRRFGHRGAPWDFNLRDLFRWCELIEADQQPPHWRPWVYVDGLFLQRMRSVDDRRAVLQLYAHWLGEPADVLLQPHYAVSREALQVGHAWLPRDDVAPADDPEGRQPLVLHSQLRPLAALMTCVRMRWMTVLTGAAGCGKTSVARLLARLTGHPMLEVTLSTATDTTELLGCFEQSDPSRVRLDALRTTADMVATVTQHLLLGHGADDLIARCVHLASGVQGAWASFAPLVSGGKAALGVGYEHAWSAERAAAVEGLFARIEEAASVLSSLSPPPAMAADIASSIAAVRTQLMEAQRLVEGGVRGRFVWVDGPLVVALQRGSWLLLDNANLCNPSVLDRLNPLLERGGRLQLPECGLQADGSVRELKAHDGFRLIFTVDPARGELSRAMRNRGVEVSLLPMLAQGRDMLSMLHALDAEAPSSDSTHAADGNAPIPLAMMAAHEEARAHELTIGACSPAALLQWGELALRRRQRRSDEAEALVEAAGVIYASRLLPQGATGLREAASQIQASYKSGIWMAAGVALAPQPSTPSAWPPACGSDGYVSDAITAGMHCQASLVHNLVIVLASRQRSQPAEDEDSTAIEAQMNQQLAMACFDFVRRASVFDLPLRRAFIQKLMASHGGEMIGLSCAEMLLDCVMSHPLYQQARSALEACCANDYATWQLVQASPVDLERLNPPLHERVRRLSAPASLPADDVRELSIADDALVHSNAFAQPPTSDDATAPWSTYTLALPRLRLMLRIEFENELERSALEQASTSNTPQDLTLLQRSFALHAHSTSTMGEQSDFGNTDEVDDDESSATAVWADVADALFPCLRAISVSLREWLQMPPHAPADEPELMRALERVHAARRALWRRSELAAGDGERALADGIELQALLVGWRTLHKRLARLSQPPLNLAFPEALRSACDCLSRAARFDATRFAAVLWKRGGHPAAARSMEQLDAETALHKLAANLRLPQDSVGASLLRDQPSHPALWVNGEVRHALLSGACTVESIAQLQLSAHGEAAALVEQLAEIPRAIGMRIEAQQQARIRKTSESVDDDDSLRFSPLPASARVVASLWPLHDLRSAGLETELLLPLASLLWSTVGDADDLDSTATRATITAKAEALVESLADDCGRSPLDAAPAQTLAWRLQSANSRSRRDQSHWLAGALCRISGAWHRHLWMGAFENAPSGNPFLTGAPEAVPQLRGPVALWMCGEVPTISAQLRRALAAPLGDRDAALMLLLRLRDALHQPAAGARACAAHDWQMLLYTLCFTLLAFRDSVPAQQAPALVQGVLQVHMLCQPLLAAASASPTSIAGLAARAATDSMCAQERHSRLTAAMESLLGMLNSSSEAALRASLSTLIAPCLDSLMQAVQLIATAAQTLHANSDEELPACHAIRGRAWTLLGLLRWTLLLPAHPVDPSCKHAVKHEGLQTQLATWRVEYRACELSQEVWNGTRSSADLHDRMREITTAQTTVQRAAERTCARPLLPAPPFAQLHREAMQWHRSLGAPSAILDLSAELQRVSASATDREQRWQQSSERFVERLADAFAGFEDVAGPLRLSVYEIKHGLRLQAASVTSALAIAEGTEGGSDASVAHSLMRSLLVFPQRMAAPSALELPVGLVSLLQPLPSQITSALCVSGGSAFRAQRWRVSQQTNLLVLALRRLYVMVLLSGQAQPAHLRALNRIMAAFAQTQVEVEAAEARRLEEAAQLYKHKTQEYGSSVDRQEQEYNALRELFPDYAEDFTDLEEQAKEKALLAAMRPVAADGEEDAEADDDPMDEEAAPDEGADGENGSKEATAEEDAASAQPLQVDPALILQLVSYHQRVFGGGGLPAMSLSTTFTSTAGSVVTGQGIGAEEAAAGAKGKKKSKASKAKAVAPVAAAAEDGVERNRAWRLDEAQREVTASLKQAHDVATELMPSVAPLLPASLDTEARGAQLALTCWTWKRLQGRAVDATGGREHATREVFAEENSEEVGRLAPLIESIGSRVRDLLAQFPEHATLQLLVQVCERIHSFRVGSPLMKFVAGAELLLKQCVAWEGVACRATSIKEQIDGLSALVLRWRKMELHAWPKLLECAATQAHEQALSNVWVRLFRVVHSSSQPEASEGAAGAGPATSEELKSHLREFFESVEHMMLSSSAGSYEAHLQLLGTFEAQIRVEERLDAEGPSTAKPDGVAVAAEGSKEAGGSTGSLEFERRRGYANILHHLAGYHRQFSPVLKGQIEKEMAPIATKLADFVKLGQWSDRNFAALKTSIERSHSQLNRCVMQYKALLDQPAATLLLSAGKAQETEVTGDAQTAAETRLADKDASDQHALAVLRDMAVSAAVAPADKASSSVAALLRTIEPSPEIAAAEAFKSVRLPALCQRMRSLCERVILAPESAEVSANRCGYMHELRETVVARANELRALTDKKARQMKQRAVTDLLKSLQASGLSYHASAVDKRQTIMSDLFMVTTTPQFDVQAAFTGSVGLGGGHGEGASLSSHGYAVDAQGDMAPTGGSASLAEKWQYEWARSEQLYYRCAFRLTQLRHSRVTYHHDLSGREVHKAVGLTEHAFTLLLHQREALSSALDRCACLQSLLSQLTHLSSSSAEEAPPGTTTSTALGPQRLLASRVRLANEFAGQVLHLSVESAALFELLGSTPQPASSPVPRITSMLKRIARSMQALREGLPEMHERTLLTSGDEQALRASCDTARQLAVELRATSAPLAAGEASHLAPLLAKLDELAASFVADEPLVSAPTGEMEQAQKAELMRPVMDAVEGATVQLLLAVQGLHQHCQQLPSESSKAAKRPAAGSDAVKKEVTDGGDAEEEEEEENLVAHHQWLRKLVSAARGEQLVTCLSAVVDRLRVVADSSAPDQQTVRDLTSRAVAELKPAVALHLSSLRWAVHQSMSYHGSLVRLELVLLNLFSELFAKGFCTAGPQEEGGEGGSGQPQDDVEGTGMGEGQGKKDISDELQDEGQIEGNSGDKKEEGPEGEGDDGGKDERANEDEGVEMTNEFDGEMKDLEQPDKQDGESEDDDGKDEPEHGMGDLDDENQEVVDERLWDKEDDDHLEKKGDEKTEDDSKMDPGGDVQMEAKEDEEEKPKKKQKQEEKKAGDDKPPDDTPPEEGQDGEDEGKGEEAGEEQAEGDVKPEKETEENHWKKPQAEPQANDEEEMPDELPEGMDGEDEGAGDDADDEPPADDGAEAEVSAGGPEDGGEDAEDDPAVGDQEPADAPPPGEGDEEEEDASAENAAPALGDDAAEDDAMEAADPPEGGQGEEQPPAEDGEEEENEADAEDEAEMEARSRKQYETQTTFEDSDGKQSAGAPKGEQDEQEQQEGEAGAPEQQQESAEGARESSKRATGGDGDGDEYMPDSSNDAPPPSSQQQKNRRQTQPNPYHALGDALAYWHRQLQMVERDAMEETAKEAAERDEAPAPPKDGGGGDEPPPGEFELTAEGEGADSQVLADATQEQFEAMAAARQKQADEPESAADEAKEAGGDEAGAQAEEPMQTTEDGGEASGAEPIAPDDEPPSQPAEPPKRSKAEELSAGPPKKRPSRNGPAGEEEDMPAEAPAAGAAPDEENGVSLVERGTARGEDDEGDDAGGHVGELRDGLTGPQPEDEEAMADPDDEAAAAEDAAADMEVMQADLEARLAEWQQHGAASGAAEDAWRALESRTASLSQELSEQLRLILEATVASKLQGDYRTGKRISMRKVIPYIASGFRKDKIWLRRTKPHKRQYQIMLCIDDSESMRDTGAGGLACEALALICQALTTVEAGQLAVLSFAEAVELLHPFERPFTAESGAHMLSRFTFNHKVTRMETLLKSVVSTMRLAREQQASSAQEQLQLVIIVSDGRKSPSWGDLAHWIRLAAQEHILLCFVIVDAAEERDSILNVQLTSWKDGQLSMSRWIDSFPFPYYLVLRDLRALPQVLSDALRQWFEMLKD